MHLQYYLRIVYRHLRLILAFFVLGLILAVAIVKFGPRTYETEADLVLIKSGVLLNLEPKYQTVPNINTPNDITSVRKVVLAIGKAPSLAAAVSAKLNKQADDDSRTFGVLSQAVDVIIDGDAVKIKARADTAEKAMLLANGWADEMRAELNTIYGDDTVSIKDIQSQADLAKQDYDTKEKAVVDFLTNQTTDRLNAQISVLGQRLTDMGATENKLDRLIADATNLRAQISSGAPNSNPGSELSLMLLQMNAFNASSQLPLNVKGTSTPLNLQLQFNPSNNVKTADYTRSLDGILAALNERRIAVHGETTGTIQSEINQLQVQLEQQTAKQQELTRGRDLALTNYTALVNKLNEAKLAAQTPDTIIRMGAPATAPEAPSLNILTTLTSFTLLGLLLGLGSAFTLEMLQEKPDLEIPRATSHPMGDGQGEYPITPVSVIADNDRGVHEKNLGLADKGS